MSEQSPIINALNTGRIQKDRSGYRLGFSLYGSKEDGKFHWTKPMGTGSTSSNAVMRTLVEAMGNEPFIEDRSLAYMFASGSKAGQQNVAALAEFRKLQESDPDNWGGVSRAEVLLGDKPISGMPAEVSERSSFYNAFMARTIARSLGKLGNPGGKYDEIITNQGNINIPFGGEITSLEKISRDPAIALTNALYGYQTLQGTSVPAGDIVKSIGALRQMYGGPLTKDVIEGMPVGMQSYISNIKEQLGPRTFNRIARAPHDVDVEQRYIDQSKAVAAETLGEYMTGNIERPPMLWASNLGALFAGKEGKYRPMEKIFGVALGFGGQDISKLLAPGTSNLLNAIYPFTDERIGELGNAFEAGWNPNLPGTSGSTIFKQTGNARSLKFDYQGGRISFKPDWLAWDEQKGQLNIVEHKLASGDAARHGAFQGAINAIGFRELGRTSQGRAEIKSYMKERGFSEAQASAISMAVQDPENIKAHLVSRVPGSSIDKPVHTDPQPVSWETMDMDVVAPGVRGLVNTLSNRDLIAQHPGFQKLLHDARNKGLNVNDLYAYFGMGTGPSAPASTAPPAAAGGAAGGSGQQPPPPTTPGVPINGAPAGGQQPGGADPGNILPPWMMTRMQNYGAANVAYVQASQHYQNALLNPGVGGLNLANAARIMKGDELYGAYMKADIKLGLAQMAFKKAIPGAGPPPQTVDEWEDYVATPGLQIGEGDQEKALMNLKDRLDTKEKAERKYREFQAGNIVTRSDIDNIKLAATNLKDLTEASQKYNDLLVSEKQNIKDITKAASDRKLLGRQVAEIDTGKGIADALGMPFPVEEPIAGRRVGAARRMRDYAQNQIEQIRSRGPLSKEDAEHVDLLQKAIGVSQGLEDATIQEQFDIQQSAKGRGFGGFARRALGGFGLMYVGHMGRMWAGTAGGTGYAESLEQEALIAGAFGAQLGGVAPRLSPEEYVGRMEAIYGGTGARGTRMLRGTLLEKSPGTIGLGETITGGMIGYAGAAWLGSLGATGIGTAAGPIGVAAGLASWGLGIYGAATSEEQTAITMATRAAKGQYSRDVGWIKSFPGANMGATSVWGSALSTFDRAYLGYVANEENIDPQVQILENMRKTARRYPGMSMTGVLKQLGITDPEEVNKYLGMYTQVDVGLYPKVSEEGLATIAALQEAYGFRLPEAQRLRAANAMGQGVPLAQTASAMLQATGWTSGQRRAAYGEVLGSITGMTASQLDRQQLGAQRFQQLGPLAQAAPSAELSTLFGQYGAMDVRSYSTLQQMGQLEMQKAALGMGFTSISPEMVPQQMSADQYVAAQLELQQQQFNIQTTGGGMFASAMSAYMPPATAARIAQQYGITTPAMTQAYQALSTPYTAYGGKLGSFVGAGQIPGMVPVGITGLITAGDRFGQLTQQFGATRTQQLAGMVSPLLAAGMPPQAMDLAVQQLGQRFEGFTDQQTLLGAQALAGDVGARSYASWYEPGVMGAAGLSIAGNRFMDQSGRPIYMSSGQDTLNLFSARGVSIPDNILGNRYMGTFMDGGLVGIQRQVAQDLYANQQASFGIQQQQIDTQRDYLATIRPLQAQQRALSYQSSMASIGFSMQRLELGYQYGLKQDDINMRRMQIQWGTSDEQAAMQRERMELQNAQQLWSMDFGRETSLMQRGFQRKDWAYQQGMRNMQQEFAQQNWQYQDEMTNLQYGWQMEDINEAIRFAHGRQRKQLVKQKDRMQIQYGMEQGQTEETRDQQQQLWAAEQDHFEESKQQQEQLWAREDEQFDKQRDYVKAIMQLEEESFDIGENARKQLQELDKEQFNLSKQQREEMYELDMANLQARAGAMAAQYELQEQINEINQKYQDDQIDAQEKLLEIQQDTAEVQENMREITEYLKTEYEVILGYVQEMAKYNKVADTLSLLEGMMNELNDIDPLTVSRLVNLFAQMEDITSGGWKQGVP